MPPSASRVLARPADGRRWGYGRRGTPERSPSTSAGSVRSSRRPLAAAAAPDRVGVGYRSCHDRRRGRCHGHAFRARRCDRVVAGRFRTLRSQLVGSRRRDADRPAGGACRLSGSGHVRLEARRRGARSGGGLVDGGGDRGALFARSIRWPAHLRPTALGLAAGELDLRAPDAARPPSSPTWLRR